MRKVLRPVLIGASSFLLGALCLFAFLKLSPGTAASILGSPEGEHHYSSSKPIVPALQLHKDDDDDEEAQAPAPAAPSPAPGTSAQAGKGGSPFPSFFDKDDEDVLGGQDPFVAMRKMHEQLEKEMSQGFAGLDQDAAIAGGEQITRKEDDKSVSYEIKGVDGSTLNTSVKNGYLTIQGETKKQNGGMTFQASFQRMFSLPPNVDASKMQTLSEKDRVVLRFPKKTS